MTEEEIKILKEKFALPLTNGKLDLKQQEEEIAQIIDFEKHMKFSMSINGGKEKRITKEEAKKQLDTESYLSGLSRATFHWSASREGKNGVSISFDSSDYWREILAEEEKYNKEQINIHAYDISYDVDYEHVAEIVDKEKLLYNLIAEDYHINQDAIKGLSQKRIEKILQCEEGALDIYNPENEDEETMDRAIEKKQKELINSLPKEMDIKLFKRDVEGLTKNEVDELVSNKIADKTGWLNSLKTDYGLQKNRSKDEGR